MTQVIQPRDLATNCQIISKSKTDYGNYQLIIEVLTNIGIYEVYNYTTKYVVLIDALKDDDIDVVKSSKELLMDLAMRSVGIKKTNDFQYIY